MEGGKVVIDGAVGSILLFGVMLLHRIMFTQ